MKDTYDRINNVCLVILTFIAFTGALIYTKSILIPFVISLFIFSVSGPSIDWFETKLKAPRFLAVALTMGIFILSSFVVSLFIVKSLNAFIDGIGDYHIRFTLAVDSVVAFLNSYSIEINPEMIKDTVRNLPVLSLVKKFSGGIVNFVSNSVLIIIMVLFLIAGEGVTKIKNDMVKQVHYKISKYVATKFFMSFITAVIVGILLFSLKVDLAFMFVILTFLLNFIPSIGSIIAVLIPLPVLFLQFGAGWELVTVMSISSAIQFCIGNVIEPKIMGENLGLHPIVILLFLLFWGLVWGIPGMFLAVPMTAVMKIVLSRIETTKTLAELLGGKLPNNI
ncbi:hypothetical protein BIY24_11485 [Halobacteriovorax marinus]|uniref:AI-2E family transporter n=1 Tax=Halobacteriovorax marinus TaxID=97084 RepID=UPI000BC323CA|nr:AI-2E family transporter [Halobacteriovorax marinus]ATH08549.1 hypothetical protein BIY24_11485 [Halobacteriovorax marinus]